MTHEKVIKEASKLIEQGINVIPVRDRDEVTETKTLPKKSPFFGWKKWQSNRIKVSQFYEIYEASRTSWIAIVLGQISRRTVAIDIDNKHWEGVEHKLFAALREMYPELWDKLRIHKTQSGGYHILFSQSEEQELLRSKKLAYKDGEKEAGIELKGEGGIIVCPPSEGYSIVKDVEIPILNSNEVAVLLAIIEDINEKKKVKKERVSKTQREDRYYSTNPFEDFNNSQEGEKVIEQYGWKYDGSNAQFIHYTRPDKKGGVSASFIKDKRSYHIFTSSDARLEQNCNYSPCSLVQTINGWTGKELYRWLVENGFGRADSVAEIKRARQLAERKSPPMPNFSEQGKAAYQEVIEKMNSDIPFGEFWKFNKQDGIVISRGKLVKVANELGFRILGENGELYRIKDGKFLHKQSVREFQDTLVDYIFSEDEDVYTEIVDATESFFQKSTDFTINRLEIVSKDLILADDKYNSFKLYKNGVVHITADSIDLESYDEFDQLIFADNIKNREFKISKKPEMYSDFLQKACGLNDYTKKILGYLSHEWKDETTGYFVLLTEKALDPTDGGGSGKNVFCSMLKEITTYGNTNGAQMSFDEKAFQSWNGEKVFTISDIPKTFPFEFLKEISTGSFKLKKLFKDVIDIPVEDAPKIILQTNYSYEVKDGGIKRRLIPLEFSDFFSKNGGIDGYYNAHFPKGWGAKEWADFDTVLCESIQLWLKGGLKLKATELSGDGWKKQFKMVYGTVIVELIAELLPTWIEKHEVGSKEFLESLTNYYNENDIQFKYRPSKNKILKAIEEYCEHNKIHFEKSKVVSRGHGIKERVNLFGSPKEKDNEPETLPF